MIVTVYTYNTNSEETFPLMEACWLASQLINDLGAPERPRNNKLMLREIVEDVLY